MLARPGDEAPPGPEASRLDCFVITWKQVEQVDISVIVIIIIVSISIIRIMSMTSATAFLVVVTVCSRDSIFSLTESKT